MTHAVRATVLRGWLSSPAKESVVGGRVEFMQLDYSSLGIKML
jgi:hypothetical protein